MITWDVKWIPKKVPKRFRCNFPKKKALHSINIEIPDNKDCVDKQ